VLKAFNTARLAATESAEVTSGEQEIVARCEEIQGL